MIYYARLQRWPVVDITQAADIIHQNHDYSHLPGGSRIISCPKQHNVALAGGKKTVFTLDDVSHEVRNDKCGRLRRLLRRYCERSKYSRSSVYIQKFKCHFLCHFHPRDAYGDLRAGWQGH